MQSDIPEEDAKIIKKIEDGIFSSMKLGIDLSELNLLDDVNTPKSKIQEIGVKISVSNTELAAAILQIAHSVYFEHGPHGDVPDFFDAVIRMGSDRVKALIFCLALFALGKGPAARLRAAKSTSIGIMGRIIAEQMNLKDELVRKVETGGLLSQLGRNVFMKAQELGANLSEEFIQKYEVIMASNLIDRLELDPFLKKAIDMSVAEFDENSLSLVGIIKLAEALTEDSFKKYGKLVVRSPMPDKYNIITSTPADNIRKLFAVLGVEDFLEIRETPTERQKEAVAKREKATVKKK